MSISCVHAVYFSPVGKTQLLTETLARQFAAALGVEMKTENFTMPKDREGVYSFGPEDLVVFGMPTQAGKLPNKLLSYVQERFSGGGALGVALVSFGNRSFDNSLAELVACMKKNEFRVVGAGAFATRHVFSRTLAAGRPDEQDLAELARFGEAVLERIEAGADGSRELAVPGDADAPYYKPLGLDGEPKVFLKAKPKTNPDLCIFCNLCPDLCPMGSIDPEDVFNVPGVCIKCHACVLGCPTEAKYFDDEQFLSHIAMLERDYTRRAEPVWVV